MLRDRSTYYRPPQTIRQSMFVFHRGCLILTIFGGGRFKDRVYIWQAIHMDLYQQNTTLSHYKRTIWHTRAILILLSSKYQHACSRAYSNGQDKLDSYFGTITLSSLVPDLRFVFEHVCIPLILQFADHGGHRRCRRCIRYEVSPECWLSMADGGWLASKMSWVIVGRTAWY